MKFANILHVLTLMVAVAFAAGLSVPGKHIAPSAAHYSGAGNATPSPISLRSSPVDVSSDEAIGNDMLLGRVATPTADCNTSSDCKHGSDTDATGDVSAYNSDHLDENLRDTANDPDDSSTTTTSLSPTSAPDGSFILGNDPSPNCLGSTYCKGCSHISLIRDMANYIENGKHYSQSQKIVCLPCGYKGMGDTEKSGGLCLFLQYLKNPPGGTYWVRAKIIKQLLQELVDSGCHNCGSIQLNPKDKSDGILTVNYVGKICEPKPENVGKPWEGVCPYEWEG